MDRSKQKMIMAMGFVAFFVMAITGFLPLIMGAKVLSGWWMILHATAAPVFSLLLAVGALLWVRSEGMGLKDGAQNKCTKKAAWAFLILFIPNALSILFSMNAWFPSSTQHTFLSVHFYTAIGLCLLVLLHLNFSRKNKG
ncbi:MAG: hypothetical protein QGH04_03495 [Candidatus Marinimicrobia bacterium]|mgnify:CR=1 FL=1|nr:hypothetical protein [Candidatus Neomarinimicrobiota bacterium]MDP7566219.1 hypothetical protein [Candidatus Neomarinimicrobiota bacterium]|tara:strand:+ start:9085 stop:9504 length:420 start_codon:yes stop_codon:yes gene_type:complete